MYDDDDPLKYRSSMVGDVSERLLRVEPPRLGVVRPAPEEPGPGMSDWRPGVRVVGFLRPLGCAS